MILKLDLQTGVDHWDLLTVVVALWILWPLLPRGGGNLKVVDGGKKRLERAG